MRDTPRHELNIINFLWMFRWCRLSPDALASPALFNSVEMPTSSEAVGGWETSTAIFCIVARVSAHVATCSAEVGLLVPSVPPICSFFCVFGQKPTIYRLSELSEVTQEEHVEKNQENYHCEQEV